MAVLSEKIYVGDVLKAETGEQVLLSRENIILTAGQNLTAGTVLGGTTIGTASVAAKSGGNTGNGTLVMDVTTPLLVNDIPGIYTVRVVTAGTNSATFRVTDPKGVELGEVNYNGSGASATFADRIKFAVTDGSTDFIVGDGFDITVGLPTAAGASYLGYKYTQLSLTATDGSQTPLAVLVVSTDATAADTKTVAAVRNSVIPSNKIIWPSGATSAQIAAFTQQLAATGITIRTGV